MEPLPQLVKGMFQLEVHTGGEADLLRLQGEEVSLFPRGIVYLLYYSDLRLAGAAL